MKAITHLLKSKRGISTVVGAALAILILLTFFSGIYLWTAVVQVSMNQLDEDRRNESIAVSATFNVISYGNYNVSIRVENIGIMDVELTRIWIMDEENNKRRYIDVSYPLPQRTFMIVPTGTVDALIRKLSIPHPFNATKTTYYFKVVTTRGNAVSSMLVPAAALETPYPIAIIPDVSKIASDGEVHLMVWNNLNYNQTIAFIVLTGNLTSNATRQVFEAPKDWELAAKKITSLSGFLEDSDVIEYSREELIYVELVNSSGQIVAACYLKVT